MCVLIIETTFPLPNFKTKTFFIILGSHGSNVTIKSEFQDIKLLVNQKTKLLFNVFNESILEEDAKIVFEASLDGVVSIDPTSVFIGKETENFTIAFKATGAGRTTVSAVDNSSSQQIE